MKRQLMLIENRVKETVKNREAHEAGFRETVTMVTYFPLSSTGHGSQITVRVIGLDFFYKLHI